MTGNKRVGTDDIRQQVIEYFHLLDIFRASKFKECLAKEDPLEKAVLIDFMIKAIVISTYIENILREFELELKNEIHDEH